MAGPPKLSEPATIICGNPIGRSTPFPIAKSTGLSDADGRELPSWAVWPNRASFSRPSPKLWVSLTVTVLFQMWRFRPNPGMLVPCEVGSAMPDLLPTHEHLDAVARAGILPKVHRPGVLVDEGRVGADKPRRAVGLEIVRAGNQWKKPQDGRVGDRRALLVTWDHAVQIESLPLSQALVRRKEEGATADDGAANRASKLVSLEGMRFPRHELEEVPRIERVVPEELVRVAAKPVCPRASDRCSRLRRRRVRIRD